MIIIYTFQEYYTILMYKNKDKEKIGNLIYDSPNQLISNSRTYYIVKKTKTNLYLEIIIWKLKITKSHNLKHNWNLWKENIFKIWNNSFWSLNVHNLLLKINRYTVYIKYRKSDSLYLFPHPDLSCFMHSRTATLSVIYFKYSWKYVSNML